MTEFNIRLGQLIHTYRLKRKLTLPALAKKVGIASAPFISNVEGGRKMISLMTFSRLAKALNIPRQDIRDLIKK